jgi:predicted RNA binding protein YcfA (HicA-like mRNA interferase family)
MPGLTLRTESAAKSLIRLHYQRNSDALGPNAGPKTGEMRCSSSPAVTRRHARRRPAKCRFARDPWRLFPNVPGGGGGRGELAGRLEFRPALEFSRRFFRAGLLRCVNFRGRFPGSLCVYIHMHSRVVIGELERAGWREVARKGSHVQFKHPGRPGRVTVPHPERDIPIGTLRSIEKQSGLRLRGE